MTREEFNAQYELLKEVGGEGGSFHALSESGAVVMVHFLGPPDGAAAQEILDNIGRLEPAESRRILEVAEVDGSPVVVTKFITDFQSLEAWLHARVVPGTEPKRPVPGTPPSPPAVDPSEAPTKVLPRNAPPPGPVAGEFTRMFQTSGETEPAPPASTPPQAGPPSPDNIDQAPPVPPAAPPHREPATPGEFTRMFQAGGRDKPPVPPPPGGPRGVPPQPPPPTPKAAPPPAPKVPDEFPGSKPAWWGPLDGEAPPKPAEPGSFTRMFRGSGLPEGMTPPPSASQPPDPLGGPPPAKTPLHLGDEPYLERLRAAPESGPPAPTLPVRSTRPPVPSGPGEFTRVIQGTPGQIPSPTPKPAAPATPQPPPPAKPPRTGVLIFGAVSVVVVAFVLVLLFALLGRGGAEPATDAPPDQETPQEIG